MFKKNYITIAAFALVAALAIAAAFVLGFCGANLSYAWSGGNEVKIVCQSQEDAKNIEAIANKSLKKYNSINSSEIRTNGATEIVVITTKDKVVSESALSTIETELTNYDGAYIQSAGRVYPASSVSAWVIPVTAVALLIALSIALHFITKSWTDVLAFLVGFFYVALFELSLIIVARIEIGTESLVATLVGVLLYTVFAFVMLLRIKDLRQKAASKEMALSDICANVTKQNILKDAILYVVIAAAAIVTVAVGSTDAIYFGVTLVVSLLASIIATYIVAPQSKALIENAFEARYKAKMRGNSK